MKREKTLTILGSTCVGKSALTLRFVKGEFVENYDPTIERSYKHYIKVDGNEYDLTVMDTAGLEEHSQIQTTYIANSHGFILVYSIENRQTYEVIKDIYNKLVLELNGEYRPIILIGNKCDLKDKRTVSKEEGESLAHSMKASFLETSAKEDSNVRNIFTKILNEIDRLNLQSNGTITTGRNNSLVTNNSLSNSNHVNKNNTTSKPKDDPKKQCVIS
jgi:small GTP-binding protein